MDILESTRAYESWLAEQTRLVRSDLHTKHKAMADGVFPFLRATFYRWAQTFPKVCPELAKAPTVLAIGDLHVENFGTWRDSEGRLIWGVNDFDEACPMPYAIDLVRLAASARLAIREDHLSCNPDEACEAVLEGYAEGIRAKGAAFVLAEHNLWLRNLAQNNLRNPGWFWEKINRIPTLRAPLPAHLRSALTKDLPEKGLLCRFGHRLAGLGSLGRQRVTLVSQWCGSMIAREAKQLLNSAWSWAHGKPNKSRPWYGAITGNAVRVPDPFLVLHDDWVIRRLAPDCSRIELSDLPKDRDELRLLRAMGLETANIHLGSDKSISQVKRDLYVREKRWLRKAAVRMEEATINDWKKWKSHFEKASRRDE